MAVSQTRKTRLTTADCRVSRGHRGRPRKSCERQDAGCGLARHAPRRVRREKCDDRKVEALPTTTSSKKKTKKRSREHERKKARAPDATCELHISENFDFLSAPIDVHSLPAVLGEGSRLHVLERSPVSSQLLPSRRAKPHSHVYTLRARLRTIEKRSVLAQVDAAQRLLISSGSF